MWVQPEITQKLYVALWAAFLASCFFPYRLVGLAVGKEAPGLGSGLPRVPGWGARGSRPACPGAAPDGSPLERWNLGETKPIGTPEP